MARVFLLSPANVNGVRARMVLRPEARFPLARSLRGDGAPLGDVMSFMSGLYFRGKRAYARAFGTAALVITPNRGLWPADEPITARELAGFAAGDIDAADPRYRRPLVADLRRLAPSEVVLLGSIASGKYVDVLLEVLGERLLFPTSFVGRGDMSRGGLMLRCVEAGTELDYAPVAGAARHGPRPARLPRKRVRPAPDAGPR